MQFEALQVFCDIARFRSFSQAAAAQQPPLTQSAASQIVHQLEKRLGVQLINRSTRPLRLTPLGQKYYEGCRTLVAQYLELETSIKKARVEMAATIHVAAIYSVGLGDMGQYLERFHAQEPSVRVHLEYLHSHRVVEKVLDESVDFGLVSFPRPSRELTILPWREEEMVVVCQPGHRLARQEAVEVSQLNGEKYIGFDKGLGIRRQVDRFLRQHEAFVEVVHEFDSVENIKKGIEEMGGVALLPAPTLRMEVAAGVLVVRPLADCRFVRPLGIICRRHHKMSPAAQRFLGMLLANGSNGKASHDGEGQTTRKETTAGTRQQARPGSNGTSHARARTAQRKKH
jgi:DNA-binding transcriptional LysR family regulator